MAFCGNLNKRNDGKKLILPVQIAAKTACTISFGKLIQTQTLEEELNRDIDTGIICTLDVSFKIQFLAFYIFTFLQ